MELVYSLAALWVSGWLMGIFALWFPAMAMLAEIDPYNVNYRYRYVGLFLFAALSFIAVPLTMFAVFSKKYKLIFLQTYVGSFLKKD